MGQISYCRESEVTKVSPSSTHKQGKFSKSKCPGENTANPKKGVNQPEKKKGNQPETATRGLKEETKIAHAATASANVSRHPFAFV